MARDLTQEELNLRMQKFRTAMDSRHPDWDTALFVSKVNQYYFTGTMQDGLLILRRGGDAAYFVRRSYERAVDESPFGAIHPMRSYRDAAGVMGAQLGRTYVESEIMTVAIRQRLEKYFTFEGAAVDKTMLYVRSVKTPFELSILEEAGRRHDGLMRDVVPGLLREGMSENELAGQLYVKMLEYGHQGVTRFQMFQTEMGIGQLGFGVSTLYPTSFDGPSGGFGLSPVSPSIGSRRALLQKGDLVFIDIGYALGGYHTDKSQVFMFGAQPSRELEELQAACIDIQGQTARLMRPGARPSDIYETVMAGLDDGFKQNFMGFESGQVRFLGHGVGLHVDEMPVLAKGFDEPLETGMTIAVEPKKGVAGAGLVGVEDTFVVEDGGARCITGGGRRIIQV